MINLCFFSFKWSLKGYCFSVLFGLILLSSCEFDNRNTEAENASLDIPQEGFSKINHAIGFDIIEYEDYKILHLFRHYNETSDTLSYVLHKENASVRDQFTHLMHIQVPLKRIALLHTSYLPFFEVSEKMHLIKAISEAKFIYNEMFYNSVIDGDVPEVSYGESLDTERLLELGISTVVTVGWPNTPNKSQQKLEELGIKVLIFSDWQEPTLLGRAEWVKVVAALTGAEEEVQVWFKDIEEAYNNLKSITNNIENRPSIICNLPYKGSWYVPGGNSYMSHLMQDAGGNYLWSDDSGTGGIQMDFELVYAQGLKADYWVNPGEAKFLSDVVAKDERLVDFRPIQTGKVYNYSKRVLRGVANDYWESAIVKPHYVLADYIKILHPELLPEHELYYYEQLN